MPDTEDYSDFKELNVVHLANSLSNSNQKKQEEAEERKCKLCKGPMSKSNPLPICYLCQDKEEAKKIKRIEDELAGLDEKGLNRLFNSPKRLSIDRVGIPKKWGKGGKKRKK